MAGGRRGRGGTAAVDVGTLPERGTGPRRAGVLLLLGAALGLRARRLRG